MFEGALLKNEQQLPFFVRVLTMADLADIILVQEQVVRQLVDKDRLQPLTYEEFQYILKGNGLMIGAYANDELIAFRALLVPPIDEAHLGKDIGLPEAELPNVIYQEISNVLPDYRGNQLQKILAKLIMQELAKQEHQYRYVCCTVAPFNIPSLKDKFAQGMRIAALKEKYEGSLRYIFVKDLEDVKEPEWGDEIFILMENIEDQQQKLHEGWQGIQMVEREGKLQVKYSVRHYSGTK
ncbi:GNAT family N-acetyltransferase [Cytobacillus sp. FJAT-53684]|uniref:GNAT family N-acetyltransferase n=1 Tax=Cytobacillus mangrovibacter TaxID=3299024 RepID=A0ABW6K3N1_9BACI